MIQKKHFTSHVERFESRLIACRLMAANMQSDWKGSLSREKKEWVFETWNVDETKLRGFTPLRLDFSQLIWEGKERNPLHFLFTSTGEVLVEGASEGSFQFQHLSFKKEVRLPDLFQLAESSDGKKTGPLHPADSL